MCTLLSLKLKTLTFSLLIFTFSLYNSTTSARPYILVLSNDDLQNDAVSGDADTSSDWDDFDDDGGENPFPSPELELDPGSWRPVLDPDPSFDPRNLSEPERAYYAGVEKMVAAASDDEPRLMMEAVAEIEGAAELGCEHAQSVMGFVYGSGQGKERNVGKGFLYHHFAAESGNLHSKMVVAYNYQRQEMYGKAVKLYAELAKVALKSFLISKDSPVIEHVRLHTGSEENTKALKKLKGEDDDDFQILDYQAQKGNPVAMYKVGLFYYLGLRGLRRDRSKALHWFTKAAEKGEPSAMEFLGEIYAKGAGVERNYTKALEWLRRASKQLYSAYNGLGYLYVKGYGVENKNYTKAKLYFEKAADNEDAGGHYNLGVLYLKGIGVKRDISVAWKYFAVAANAGQPKALYQLAKMSQTGVAIKKDLAMATNLYKIVAERGPWSSLSRLALEAYLDGDIGKALLLYSRMAELGYEFAQSNAAWILDKYGENGICLGETGFCTDVEIHQRAHSLWWQASEQGNEQAALLIGDAYYYGRGTERDYERAAEAYMHAKTHSNAQAIFNLGYMHEHGQGLPYDLHLAKRYYDQALAVDPAAKLPVTLALASLWIRKNYADGFLVHIIDSLPEVYPKLEAWVDNVLLEEGNATILTLIACLLTVLYLRERQRRQVAPPAVGVPLPHHPIELAPPAPH